MAMIIVTGILFLFLPDTVGFSVPRDMEDVRFLMENSKPLRKLDCKGWSLPSRAENPKRRSLES